MGHLETVQEAMRNESIDALLLGGEAAGFFVAGHTRIGVHPGGSVLPLTVVPASGLPHVITGDPDGATHLPADHVHATRWSPVTLARDLPKWLDGRSGMQVGIDMLSPTAHSVIQDALVDCRLVDATTLLATAMLPKSPEEINQMAELCRFVTAAAEEGLRQGRPALMAALGGAFPIAFPQVSSSAVSVAIRRNGMVAEARLGPGSPAVGERALEALVPGATVDDVAAELPAGVEVIGLGWGIESPVLRNGMGSPSGLRLQTGAVLAVRWAACGVTVALGEAGIRFLSLEPSEVTR
jgi:Creatinase/Prolidase N-terminal domain